MSLWGTGGGSGVAAREPWAAHGRVLALAVGLALAIAVPAQAQSSAGDSSASADGELTIHADRDRITAGQRITFTGRRRPEDRGRVIELQYRRPGESFRTVAATETDGAGRYEVGARPRRSGVFRAVSPRGGGALRSEGVDVGVRFRLRIEARRHQRRERRVKVAGALRPRDAGRRVVIQRRAGGGWDTVATTRTGEAGAFRARFAPPRLGTYKLRARVEGSRSNLGNRAVLGHPVYVYREDEASYYGPGFYGNRTACGQVLREDTVGVAHKRLPCGTRVRFHYRGRTRQVRVIDRGPFIGSRRWDLTEAARRELRFPRGVDEIWADR